MVVKIVLILVLITIVSSDLVPELSCNFDDFCHYLPNENDTHGWQIKTNPDPRESFLLDGPLDGVSGSYLELNGASGGLQSPPLRLSGEYCLSLDFYLFSSSAALSIYAQRPRFPDHIAYHPIASSQQHFPLFNRDERGSLVDRWQHHEINYVFEDDDYVIRIEGTTTINNTVAIDNLRFAQGPCRVTPSDVRFCKFDNIVGGVNGTDNNCDWLTVVKNNLTGLEGHELQDASTRLRFFVKSSNHRQITDPDYTTKTKFGGYLNAFATFRYKPTIYVTDLLTPQDGAHCLQFAYGSYGKMEVFEKELDHDTINILWESPQNVHEMWWEPAQVDIDPVVNIQVGIKLTRSGGKLDGIRLSKGRCKPYLECDFKDGMCDWSPNYSYDGDWLVGKGRAAVPLPEHSWTDDYDQDYLSLDSHYMNLRGRFGNVNFQCLRSMIIQETGDYCFRFSFFARAGLEPIVRERRLPLFANLGMPDLPITFTGDPAGWREGTVNIRAKEIFGIELFPGLKWNSTMPATMFRLRKTSLEKGLCNSNSTRVQQFGPINFHCYRTGHNIPMYRSCDGVIDCPMGEDEGDNCEPHQCESGGIPCRRRKHHFCLIDTTQFCNGARDCDDGSDEDPRMCNAESFCDNYCLNDGQCSHSDFSCDCSESFRGKRCATN